jgi:hypothetical protein
VFEGNSSKEPPPNKWMMWHASMSMKPAPVAEVIRGFPATLSEVIARLMAKPLGQRYASAEELLSDLAVLRHEMQTPAAVVAAPQSPARRASRAVAATPPMPNAKPTEAPATLATAPAAAAPDVSGVHYWVRLRGRVTGPFDLPTLQKQLKQGQISRMHQVSTDQAAWKQASEIEGLYGPTTV